MKDKVTPWPIVILLCITVAPLIFAAEGYLIVMPFFYLYKLIFGE